MMLVTALAGCSDSNGTYPYDPNDGGSPADSSPGNTPSTGNTEDAEHVHGVDFDAAFATFPPDTVMIITGDYNVTWAELYFNLRNSLEGLVAAVGGLPDLSSPIAPDITYADMVLEFAVDNAITYKVIEFGAKMSGVTISADDLYILDTNYQGMVEQLGGEEEFLKALWERDGISDYDLFLYIFHTGYLANLLFDELLGIGGSLVSDEEAASLTSFEGYLMAKHILRLKSSTGDDNALEETEEILRQLNDYDGDDLHGFFTSLMFEHTEDGGISSFPQGYLFQIGDMVHEFYEACVALEPGQISGIVETVYGYHIVMRLPINYDTVPSGRARVNDFRTLRQMVASSMFEAEMQAWTSLLQVEFTPEFDLLDIASLFAGCQH